MAVGASFHSRHVPAPAFTKVVCPDAGSAIPAEMLLYDVAVPESVNVRPPVPDITMSAEEMAGEIPGELVQPVNLELRARGCSFQVPG